MKNVAIFNTCIGGSTGKIAVGLYKYLANKGYNPVFCYGRENGRVLDNYYRIGNKFTQLIHVAVSRFFCLQGYGSFFSTLKLIRFLNQKNIDTVYIINIHGYYINEPIIYKWIIRKQTKVIYIMADEYAFLGKCGYGLGCSNYLNECHNCPQIHKYPKSFLINGAPVIYKMKKKAYKQIKSITFVGPAFTVSNAKKSPLLKDQRIEILDEAIDTSRFSPKDNTWLKEKLGISEDKIVITCVAPFSLERKGCKYFVELAKRFESKEEYVFVHVGFDISKKKITLPRNYLAIDFISDQEMLALYYSLGDLFVFPSVSDTMPNACLEALSSGTPLLCFNTSGMPFIADDTVATFVTPRSVDELEAVVSKTGKKTNETILTCREYALRRYDSRVYYSKLINL